MSLVRGETKETGDAPFPVWTFAEVQLGAPEELWMEHRVGVLWLQLGREGLVLCSLAHILQQIPSFSWAFHQAPRHPVGFSALKPTATPATGWLAT